MNWKAISKEIFGLVLRLIGITLIYQGLIAVPNAISSFCPGLTHFYWRNVIPALLVVGWPLFVGYWLIRRTPRFMDLAYGQVSEPPGSDRPL